MHNRTPQPDVRFSRRVPKQPVNVDALTPGFPQDVPSLLARPYTIGSLRYDFTEDELSVPQRQWQRNNVGTLFLIVIAHTWNPLSKASATSDSLLVLPP